MNAIGEENVRRLELLESRSSSSCLVMRWEGVKTMNRIDIAEALLDSQIAPK